jgi:alkanesulfonate monooxygenase SsuD/methylene tetrahydromethanopterin reductase-like flavin-dependent oxidoreductase (luciferase family)
MSGLGLVLSLPSVGETVQAARLAEAAGFESVWATEFTDRSATVAMAAMAAATERITIGSAIAYAFGRTPLVLAAEARDLDALSGGRLILGLGTGTKRMQQDWHGLDGEHPAGRMEELLPLVRRLLLLHEGPVVHEGRFYRVIVRPALARGAERADRSDPVPIAGYVTCSVDDDAEAARRSAKAIVAFNASVKTYAPIVALHGFEAEAEAIRTAWRAGDWGAMTDAVSDRMVDTIALAGTPGEVREQYRERRAGLFERTLLWPPAIGGLDAAAAVIEAFRD